MTSLQVHPKRFGKDCAVIDPCTIFNRLLAVAKRLNSIESAFEFELTAEPLSLLRMESCVKQTRLHFGIF